MYGQVWLETGCLSLYCRLRDESVDVGTIIQGMVLDTLSSRSPLYRLASFFLYQDTELLFGRVLPETAFNDTTVARAMDVVFEVGAQKVFSEVAFQAAKIFPLNMNHVHFDTTSYFLTYSKRILLLNSIYLLN